MGKKVTIYLDADEAYPVYSIVELNSFRGRKRGFPLRVPVELVQRLLETTEAFWAAQGEISDLLDIVEERDRKREMARRIREEELEDRQREEKKNG